MQAMLVGAAAPPPPSPVMCPMCQGAGQTKEGRRPLGDVAVDIVSPWEIYPVAGARKVTDGVFHAHAITLDQASAKYGFSKEEIGGRGGFDEATPWFSKLARSRQIDGLKLKENQVWVVERWLPPLPGSEHPRLTILVGNRLAWPRPGVTPGWEQGWGEIAEPYGRIPIFHFRLRPAAEDFWSEGIVPDMISCNDFINRARASFHRHQQTMAYTKWMVEKGSVDEEALTNEEGEVVEYWGAEPPIQRSPAPMPEFYVRLAEKEEQNIPRLAGLQEVDQGKAPPNIEAFQALHFLAEQSETVQGPVLLEDECQWRAVARAVLVCAASNYDPTEQRMIRINGAGSKLEVEALLASDLSTNIDIQCEIGSALAHSQALRQEQVFRALESGIITPQEARRLAEFGIMLGENDGDHRLQESTAEQENQAMAQGQSHAVMLFAHDHDVHIAAHRRAALEAQIDGNLQLAHALDQAALHHIMAKQQAALQSAAPPAPQPQAPQPQSVPSPIPGAANAPFDSHQMPQQYEAAGMGITQ
jgi:hypothetical protein